MRRCLFIAGIVLFLSFSLAAERAFSAPVPLQDGGDEYDDGSGMDEDEDNGGDEYDDDMEYEINGAGDQYIQISLMPSFPLGFNGNMYVGGAAQLSYRRFLLKWLAIGGDLMIGYHPTIGSNIFNFWPITFAVTFQPALGKFEFPISIGTGVAFETYRNNKYFPGFVLKPEVCAFYRINESWSAGVGSSFLWLPQWYDESKYNYNGFFITASLSARYHF